MGKGAWLSLKLSPRPHLPSDRAIGEDVGRAIGEDVGRAIGEDVGRAIGEDVGRAIGELLPGVLWSIVTKNMYKKQALLYRK